MALFRGLSSGLSRGLSLGLTGGGGGVEKIPLIIKAKTDNSGDSLDTEFSFEMRFGGASYNLDVDWCDGNSETFTTFGTKVHDYGIGNEGTYTVTIGANENTTHSVQFNDGDSPKVVELVQHGNIPVVYAANRYNNCANMVVTATDVLDLSFATSTKAMFKLCTAMVTGPIIYAPLADTLEDLYRDCTALETVQDITITSTCTKTQNMCRGCTALMSVSLPSFDTSGVATMFTMFYAVPADVDISGFNISSLTSAASMMLLSGFAQANYELMLVAWEGQPHNNSVAFHAGTATYAAELPATDAELARALLVSQGWTITDGGFA